MQIRGGKNRQQGQSCHCRAGADWVVGAEVHQAMCDAGVETLVLNGFGAKCVMVNKDVRRMDVTAKPDGTPADMQQKADIAVFEVHALSCSPLTCESIWTA